MSVHGQRIDNMTIRFERLLPGPIERVWAYLTEPEKRAEWFAGGVTELKAGGRAEFIFNHSTLTPPDDKPPKKFEAFNKGMRFEGEVLEVDPPRLLVWGGDDGDDYIETRFELESRGDKVLLTLTEAKLSSLTRVIGNAVGWHAHLELLSAKLAGETPPPFWATHARLEEEYEARWGAA
ncbi:MAG: SRPBCC family protein [Pseudomonadota bacterium]|nr:SRPBCC family protein [Pseudomonadota bacterium]